MTLFEYLSVAVSIVLSLSAAQLLASVRAVGEPFKSAVRSEDLPKYIKGSGWTLISDVDTNPAHGIERYAIAERS